MHITVANEKGGVTKTTTAIHLAAYLQRLGPTLLIDKDPSTRSASGWAESGKMPFTILGWEEGVYQARNFEHVVIDTKAGEDKTDIVRLAKGCDMLVIPTVPGVLDTDALIKTVQQLAHLPEKYKVLIARVPPRSSAANILREKLAKFGVPHFKTVIPRLQAFDLAVAAGVPVYDVADEYAQNAWAAYEAVGEELCHVQAAR
jgi:chromosome partitioning protein